MKIAIVQMEVEQGDFKKNLEKADSLAKKSKDGGAQLAVFPEMFLCGFNYKKNLDFLRNHGDAAERELCEIAKRNGIALCGSLPHLSDGDELPTNRFIFINEEGERVSLYDKIHLFGVFHEDKYVKSGNEIVVAKTPFGEIGFSVCYDIRFPDLYVRMAKKGAKIVIISAAFPHPRSEHWRILSRARAIENQCFVVAVNHGGTEAFGKSDVKYFGMSAVIDPWGTVLAECAGDCEDISFADINLEDVDNIREQIPSFSDRRDDIY